MSVVLVPEPLTQGMDRPCMFGFTGAGTMGNGIDVGGPRGAPGNMIIIKQKNWIQVHTIPG